jgi:undecaprenyl-diphosphatase
MAVSSERERRVLWAVVAAVIFAVVAGDVLLLGSSQGLLRLDRYIRASTQSVAHAPAVRSTASLVSDITGEGLAVLVAATTIGLLAFRRRREALVFLAGVLSAWAMSGLLKVVFGVPRPRARPPWSDLVSYGFPSGHAFVTLVALGLLAWAAGRRAARPVRVALGVAAGLIALTAGVARVILDAHWLTDVVAGLALGTAWVNLVVVMAEPALAAPGKPPTGQGLTAGGSECEA